MRTESPLQTVKISNIREVDGYLSLTVAAPGIDICSAGQSEHVFTAHSDVFYEQPLQRWNHLGGGFMLQHGVWQANQTL